MTRPHPKAAPGKTVRPVMTQQQQLAKVLEDLKYALDQAAIVAITDTDGNILEANATFCKISGFSRSELIGQNHRIVNSGHHPPAFFKTLWETIRAGNVWRGEICNRTKHGDYYWVDTTIVPMLDEAGQPYQYIAIRYEITDRKRMEADLQTLNRELDQRVEQRTQALETAYRELERVISELQESERLRETFISALTHDLRTPLIAQQRAFELFEKHADKCPPNLSPLISSLLKSNDGLLQLVNRLLEIHQYGAGKVQLTLETLSLKDLIAECFAEVAILAESKQIRLEKAFDENLPAIKTDRLELKRVLMNLIANAIEAIEAADSQGLVRVEAHRDAQTIEIRVIDNGPGLPADVLPYLFSRYYVIQKTRKRIGAGLGLSICSTIMEVLGGRIWVESTSGQGSTFCLALPLAPSLGPAS